MQAVLILAHKNIDQVFKLSKKMSTKFEVYVHFDKKVNLSKFQKKRFLDNNINIFSVYDVKWGSFSIVKATFFLICKALENPQITYFHLISGQDWPMLNVDKIYDCFENDDKIYLNYVKATDKRGGGEPEILWVKYYYNYDRVNRRSFFGKLYHRILLLSQTIFRIDKLKKYGIEKDKVFAGQEWFDIPRDAMKYIVKEFKENKKLYKVFSTSFCSDEMLIPTILCNSKYKSRIEKNIHRYILPVRRHGTLPAILDMSDFAELSTGKYWWGRKIESPYSDELIERINKKV